MAIVSSVVVEFALLVEVHIGTNEWTLERLHQEATEVALRRVITTIQGGDMKVFREPKAIRVHLETRK